MRLQRRPPMIRVMDDAAEEAWLRLDRDVFMSSWYSQMYESHTYGGLAGIAQDWMHRSLERGYSHSTAFSRLLEVGGNVGEHVPFVKHAFDEYLLTDLHDSLSEEQRAKLAASSISFSTADVQALPWDPGTFDRVVNTCLLHHVPDPELALMEIRRVLKDGGRGRHLPVERPGWAVSSRSCRWAGARGTQGSSREGEATRGRARSQESCRRSSPARAACVPA